MKLRRRQPRQVSFDEPVALESSMVPREYGRSDPHLLGAVDRIALVRAIKELPDGYRTIFILHDVEGYDHREIARLLRCSTGNSKSQLHKARLKIREFLMAEQQQKLAAPAGPKPNGVRAKNINAVPPAPSNSSRTRTICAPKGYEEVLLNCWEVIGMWGELLQRQRG